MLLHYEQESETDYVGNGRTSALGSIGSNSHHAEADGGESTDRAVGGGWADQQADRPTTEDAHRTCLQVARSFRQGPSSRVA